MFKLINGDCLEVMQSLIDDGVKVDMILTDPPYGTMDTDGGEKMGIHNWDKEIDLNKLNKIFPVILRPLGKMLLFSQEPYTAKLITSINKSIKFNQRLIWLKETFANPLGANKNCVNFYEDINLFSNHSYDVDKKHPLRNYFLECQEKSNMSTAEFNKLLNTKSMANHYFTQGIQFCIPSKEKYEVLQTTGFFPMDYEEIKAIDLEFKDSNKNKSVFNLEEGKRYKSNVFKYPRDNDGFHPTQKPVKLLEDLIKTYTNENDLVLDFTMGSGSTGVACKNTNRQFIGIELDKDYYQIAQERCKNYQTKLEV